ncbi:CesT family type III secretion system chaperone [Bradyrhizobium sp. CCGUVB23]|uniref:CesT family type III secretion system chaperone n=1 Tax=Bradyrhizobium sp. CCGUVB23 TaxID=2949630 RepID=UPI0020B2519C|nr:CesT family type III secretion system chaperone [Bradyrhizobium sp. CCGUVB23]MCP3463131.1 CesT family type III secretion system chaperone [Bradyrhizobium sp. CCGUVB23]
MARTFFQWLSHYSDVMSLDDVGDFARDRTLIVHDVVCTFVHPCGELHDIAAVLLDAGMVSTVAEHDLVRLALSRNLENFLLGAPLFFVNPSSRHLVLGQKFEFAQIDPPTFAPLLDALALQAKAWRDGRSGAR